jgi:hypothetical protein
VRGKGFIKTIERGGCKADFRLSPYPPDTCGGYGWGEEAVFSFSIILSLCTGAGRGIQTPALSMFPLEIEIHPY